MKKKKFNITKFLRLFLICLIIIPCIFTFSACKSKEAVYVVSIEKTKTDGLKDTYTITYSDGSTSEIVITNGKTEKMVKMEKTASMESMAKMLKM